MAEVIWLVRSYPDKSMQFEGAVHRAEKGFIDETAWSMPSLRPRIGEHEVKHGNRILGEEPFHRVRNLDAQNAGVCQTSAFDFSTCGANPAEQTLDSEKVSVRIGRSRGGEKRTIAAAQVDFERREPAKDRREIERLETIHRDEFDVAWYC